jgi:hypothetical protein
MNGTDRCIPRDPREQSFPPNPGTSEPRPAQSRRARVTPLRLALAAALTATLAALVAYDYRTAQLLPQTRLKLRLAIAASRDGDPTPADAARPESLAAASSVRFADWQQPFLHAALPCSATRGATTIHLDRPDTTSPTSGIQEAIDALPPSGGVVALGAGVFPLRAAARLRSGTVLHGSGAATLLRRARPHLAPLAADVAPGDTLVRLATSDFAVGTSITVRDAMRYGDYTLHATVRAPGVAVLERPAPYAILSRRGAQASDFSSALLVAAAHDVVIRDLAVDAEGGAREASSLVALDFTDAAVAVHRSHRVAVLHVVVRDYPSDGISVQGGADVLVRGDAVVGVAANGIHIGSSVQGALVDSVLAARAGLDGVYFCAGVTASRLTHSLVLSNAGSGVGGLGAGGDRGNLVEANTAAFNGRYGIQVGETGNLVARNAAFSNGVSPSSNLRVEWSSWRPRLVSNDTTHARVDDVPTVLERMGLER